MSLKNRIVKYVYRSDGWVHSGKLERLAMDAGYKAGNAGRRCRELAEAKVFERRENKKGHVEYKCDELPRKYKVKLHEFNKEEIIKYSINATND